MKTSGLRIYSEPAGESQSHERSARDLAMGDPPTAKLHPLTKNRSRGSPDAEIREDCSVWVRLAGRGAATRDPPLRVNLADVAILIVGAGP